MLHPCLGVTMKIETIDQAISTLNKCKDEKECEWAIHNLASFFRIYAQTGNAVLTDLFTALLKHLDSNTNPPPWFNYEQLLMHV